ncbi:MULTISPECIES: hypothetical protein [Clostridium]|uniref:hypothetical protein n=1 Tax=Clostridium TaxID=1485 RepID=UPI0008263937|nr:MULTISPECIES: hypothetical protein [Clostridium]PJI07694.1 hypothetical protein CUB90_07385 [Clostridium sp. CT7]
MKSKKNIKIAISIVSLVILMFTVGCSNVNGNSNDKQSTVASDNSKNKASNQSSSEVSTSKGDLNGKVAKIDGNNITIIKTNEKKGSVSMPKKGSAAATQNMTTFQVSNDTAVTVRTSANKGMDNKDAAGTISDIKEDSMLMVWGKKDGDVFKATKVLVYVFK